MEFMRDMSSLEDIKNIKTRHFGTLEDFHKNKVKIDYPQVFKGASGAISSAVCKAKNHSQVIKSIKNLCRSISLFSELWDLGRSIKHPGYIRDSKYRRKFILQTFIPNMDKDWKVIVFGMKYFVLERSVRPGDFRASGSGLIKYNENLPNGLLNYAKMFFDSMNVPFLAMDIGFTGNEFCLIEFQGVNFGTHTVDTAPFYFTKENQNWKVIKNKVVVENEFVESISNYLNEIR